MSADLVQQIYKFMHKDIFCAVFRGPKFLRVEFLTFSPLFEQINMVVNFEPPGSAVNPLAKFTAASHLTIDECAKDIDDAVFVTEFYFRAPADKFLPQCAGFCRGRIDLKLKWSAEADPVKNIAEKFTQARRRDENFHCADFADSQIRAKLRPINIEDFDFVNLACEAAADKIFNYQFHFDFFAAAERLEIIDKLCAGLVAPLVSGPKQRQLL